MFFMLFFFFFSNYIYVMEVPTDSIILAQIKKQTNQSVIDWSSPETISCAEDLLEQGELPQDSASLWEHRSDLERGFRTISADHELAIIRDNKGTLDKGKKKPVICMKHEDYAREKDYVCSVAISPDKNYVAYVGLERRVIVKNLKTKQVTSLEVDREAPDFVTFLDAKHIVTQGLERIQVTHFKRNFSDFYAHWNMRLSKLCILPEQEQILFTTSSDSFPPDYQIILLDHHPRGIRYLKKLMAHTEIINDLTSNKEGLCASASRDKTVKVWDLQRPDGQECVATFEHASPVESVCFDGTGKFIFVVTDYTESVLYIWNVATQQLMKKISHLTPESSPSSIRKIYCSTENDSLLIEDCADRVSQCNPDLLFLSLVADNFKKKKGERSNNKPPHC